MSKTLLDAQICVSGALLCFLAKLFPSCAKTWLCSQVGACNLFYGLMRREFSLSFNFLNSGERTTGRDMPSATPVPEGQI